MLYSIEELAFFGRDSVALKVESVTQLYVWVNVRTGP